jgi:hypothetical protein
VLGLRREVLQLVLLGLMGRRLLLAFPFLVPVEVGVEVLLLELVGLAGMAGCMVEVEVAALGVLMVRPVVLEGTVLLELCKL